MFDDVIMHNEMEELTKFMQGKTYAPKYELFYMYSCNNSNRKVDLFSSKINMHLQIFMDLLRTEIETGSFYLDIQFITSIVTLILNLGNNKINHKLHSLLQACRIKYSIFGNTNQISLKTRWPSHGSYFLPSKPKGHWPGSHSTPDWYETFVKGEETFISYGFH